MLKRWQYLVLAVEWIVLEPLSSWFFACCNYEICQQVGNHSAEGGRSFDCFLQGPAAAVFRMYIDYIGSPSDAYLILFTFVLAISTIALWNATRDAANAAKIAAEHIPTVERAYVYPRVVSNNITVSMEEIANGGDPARFPQQIGFRIKNYGKTPAFLRDVVGHLGYFSNEPRIHTADDTHISGDVALEAGGETETFTAWLKPPLTPTEIMEIYGGEATLMFSGWITFDDIWGDPQPSRQFSWTWNDTKGVFVPHLERHQKQQ